MEHILQANGEPTESESEAQLRLVMNTLPGLIAYVDRHLCYRFVNARHSEWFGRSGQDFTGHTVPEVLGQELFSFVKPYVERALAGETVVYEHTYAYRPDLIRDVQVTYLPDRDGNGIVKGFVVVLEDITARKLAERKQQEIDRQLSLLIEASGKLLASPDSTGVLRNILDLAKHFVEADGYSVWRKDNEGRRWQIKAMSGLSESYSQCITDLGGVAEKLPREPFAVEDVEQSPFADLRREAYKSEGIRSLITVPLQIHGELSGTLVFYYRTRHRFTELETRVAAALGNLAAAALSTAELYARETELRRHAEAEERKAQLLASAGQVLSSSLNYEETLAAVVDLAVPVFADWASIDVFDENDELHRVAMKHIDPAKIAMGHEFRRKYPPDERDAGMMVMRTGKSILVPEITDELLAQGARDEDHLKMIRELGLKSVILVPLRANERTFGLLSFVTAESNRQYSEADLAFAEDLGRRAATAVHNARLFTESTDAQKALQRSNAQLQRANEDLNQFAYSASHDLQEPLRIMAIYSQLLNRKYESELDEKAREYLSFIVDGAKRMETLLRDLLIFIQAVNINHGELPGVNTCAALEKAVANLKRGVIESRADIRYSELPKVRIQEIHLVQLFQNIIGNAIKYRGDEKPIIEIGARGDGAACEIYVKDNGIGIAPEYQTQIFGLFKRLHNWDKYPGTGIGLAICQKIVERYGGRIWVESTGRSGSTFRFTLPA
jgi:PAS domain S-box-containing protein